jgi:hypothetical protein
LPSGHRDAVEKITFTRRRSPLAHAENPAKTTCSTETSEGVESREAAEGNGETARMNPLRWHRPQQIALAICVTIGGSAGVIVGYLFYRLQDGSEDFGEWALMPFTFNLMDTAFYNIASIEWFAVGGLMGAGLLYAVMLAKKSN